MAQSVKTFVLRISSPSPLPAPNFEREIEPLVAKVLAEAKKEDLLTSGALKFRPDENFAGGGVGETLVAFHVGRMAYDVFKTIILPHLKKNFGVKELERPKVTKEKSQKKSKPAKVKKRREEKLK